MSAYDRAISIKPDYAEVHYNRGALLQQTQQTRAALASFEAALAISPLLPEAHLRRAILLQQLGQVDEAEMSYKQAIVIRPGFTDAYFNLGMLQNERGNNSAALTSFDAAISLAPNHAESHAGRGLALLGLRQRQAAIDSFKIAARLNPHSARIFGNLAQTEAGLGLIDDARGHHDKAVSLDPGDAAIQFHRGNFLSDLKEWHDAIQSYQAAIALKFDYAESFCNLGLAQQEVGQTENALQSYSRALEFNPQLATAYNNRGNVFRTQKRFAEAQHDYQRAIKLDPNLAEAHYNFAQLALLTGDLLAGWPEYEWRSLIEEAAAANVRRSPHPTWSGESLQGKTILLHAEQGLGDTIQFCRYVPMVASLGARVVLQIQPALSGLLKDLKGVDHLTIAGAPVPNADYQCSLLSLPMAFKTKLETIPNAVPYLHSDPNKVARWREILSGHKRPRVGLAWSGNPLNRNDRDRSLALSHLIDHLPDQLDYICLQKYVSDADVSLMNSSKKFIDVESHNVDFTDTAALIETLDLVISVDTSLAHLSGSLGKTTWILLPFLPDWRWMAERSDSPWYPSATLYRQPAAGEWLTVMKTVRTDLLRFTRVA